MKIINDTNEICTTKIEGITKLGSS